MSAPLYKLLAENPKDIWLRAVANNLCSDKCPKKVKDWVTYLKENHSDYMTERKTVYDILVMLWKDDISWKYFGKGDRVELINYFVQRSLYFGKDCTLNTLESEVYYGLDKDDENEMAKLEQSVRVLLKKAKEKGADKMYDVHSLHKLNSYDDDDIDRRRYCDQLDAEIRQQLSAQT